MVSASSSFDTVETKKRQIVIWNATSLHKYIFWMSYQTGYLNFTLPTIVTNQLFWGFCYTSTRKDSILYKPAGGIQAVAT